MFNRIKQPQWWHIDRLLLIAFVAATGVLSGSGQMRLVGIGMGMSLMALHFLGGKRKAPGSRLLPPELICYTLFVIWTAVSGIIIAINPIVFWLQLQTLFQMLVMVLIVYGLLWHKMTPNMVFMGLVIASLTQGFVVITGRGVEAVVDYSAEQATGLTNNSNALGAIAVYGVLAGLFLWRRVTRWSLLNKAMIFGIMTANAYVITASGSRKSGIIFAVACLCWGIFILPRGKNLGRMMGSVLAVLALITVAYFVIPTVMSDSVLGKRLMELKEKEGGGSVKTGVLENERLNMYKRGWQMFLGSPIAGVGLGQFEFYYDKRSYSHSDIIEPLATTGGIGFILYESFYVILLVRLRKLIRWTRDENERYRLKLMVLMILSILCFGLGGPHILSQNTFVILITISAYTWARLQEKKVDGGRLMGNGGRDLNHGAHGREREKR
jgi:O-Antigen ligase